MSIDKRRCAVLLAAGVLLPLPALTGCSSGDDDGPPSPAARDIAPASRAQTAPGGTLRWALDARPATFNAFQTSADTGTERIAGAVLPALHTLDARGRPQRNGDYLESAEVVSREPKQVVVYKLNPKAVWSDGRPLGAEDFSAQWKALRGTENAYWTARNAGYDRIARIQPGEKDHEVKVTFAKPYTDWRSLFTPLYPKRMMSNPAVFNAGARKGLPVTSGPFMVRAVKDTSVTLVRNPTWWGDRARLNRLVFEAVPAGKRAAALVDGTLDMAEVDRSTARRIQAAEPAGKRAAGARLHPSGKAGAPGLETHGQDAADATRARAEAERADAGKAQGVERSEAVALRRYALRTALDPAYTQLAINGTKGPLADERVRRAVARAIDRQALAKLVLKPFGLPTEPLGNHLLMSEQKGYKDHSGALGGPDTQAAQSLLADAGWRPGGSSARQKSVDGKTDERSGRARPGVVRKKGRPLVLRFVVPSDSGGSLRAVGTRIGRMLEEIGVRTEITKVKSDSFFKDHIATGKYDLALYSWPASAYPATDGRPIYAKPQPAADGSLVVEQNYTRVGTDQIDQLFDEALTELDGGASRALVGRADARIWAAAGSIPLYQPPQLVAVRKTVGNAGAFGFATPRYQDIGFRK
ncbi:ABC transporter family substrate-binding protein [Streptomyces sp. BRA346]|uniref:ABC transporter family substrate-binding protein n=1 Tax=Streptomyces sp. BRA346 TaxID=2878199 RepID=UPI004062EDD4